MKMWFLSSLALLLPLSAAIEIKPYYTYMDQDLELAKRNSTQLSLTNKELERWDNTAARLIQEAKLKNGQQERILAYLYSAQRDFSYLSNGKGSINPVSAHILALFFPNAILDAKGDEYSETLGSIVYNKYRARFLTEDKIVYNYPVVENETSYKGEKPFCGIWIGSYQPWGFEKSNAFRPSGPPPQDNPEWKTQLATLKSEMLKNNEKVRSTIHYWDEQADWNDIASNYMQSHKVPLQQQFQVRAVLAQALEDTKIAVYDAKYTYWTQRPHERDTAIETEIPCPNRPSYPAAFSAMGTAAATVLSTYFPENQSKWYALADEAGYSRIHAGLLLPIDHIAGERIGKQVAEAELKK